MTALLVAAGVVGYLLCGFAGLVAAFWIERRENPGSTSTDGAGIVLTLWPFMWLIAIGYVLAKVVVPAVIRLAQRCAGVPR